MTNAGDLELARRAITRAPDAMKEFLVRMRCVPRFLKGQNERFGRPLDRAELDDVAQNVMLLVWRKLPQFEGRAPLENWVFRICHLEMFAEMRRKKRRPTLDPDRIDVTAADPRMPVDVLAIERVLRLLDGLPENQARIIRMKQFELRTFDEIAAELSMSPNTVKTTYYRTLVRLQDQLGPDTDEARESGEES